MTFTVTLAVSYNDGRVVNNQFEEEADSEESIKKGFADYIQYIDLKDAWNVLMDIDPKEETK